MTTTATIKDTIKAVLDAANPSQYADALHRIKLGTMLTPISETITLAAPAASINLVTDSVAKRAAQKILSCRVTAVPGGPGTGTAGPRVICDAAATPDATVGAIPGVVAWSADGKTLTFDGLINAAVVAWLPRPDHETSVDYAPFT
jgi:hypothetical protein